MVDKKENQKEKSRIKGILSSVGLVTFSTVFSLLVAEIALRFTVSNLSLPFLIYLHPNLKERLPLVREKIAEGVPWANVRKEDLDTGWTFEPNLIKEFTNEDGESGSFSTSPEGFFTPDVPAKG
ncbi:MAG: hypothetical protein F6J92_34820, partial [Symploca sp. SIO1A3]|nr:hypothetical protein [Symploca sp. SIO1A3]